LADLDMVPLGPLKTAHSEVVREPFAQHVGQRAQDRLVFARVAGHKERARRHLHAAFGRDRRRKRARAS
jgi:hypothetical protein